MSSSDDNDKSTPSSHDNDLVALEVRNLSKFWESQAGRVIGVANITFNVKKGEFVSIVGPSGSGKSTLLNMLGALERPSSGQVFINGIDIYRLNDSKRRQ